MLARSAIGSDRGMCDPYLMEIERQCHSGRPARPAGLVVVNRHAWSTLLH